MASPTTISSSRLAAIIAAARAKKDALSATPLPTILATPDSESPQDSPLETTDKYGKVITYNEKQQQFINLASSHKSCILIGAAGTGKTTCMKGTVSALAQSPDTGILKGHDHKHLPEGVPGIVVLAYTRRATNNIRRNMDESMKANCITIHKFLEYAPTYFEVLNEAGESKTTMQFLPSRNQDNPLPRQITTIII